MPGSHSSRRPVAAGIFPKLVLHSGAAPTPLPSVSGILWKTWYEMLSAEGIWRVGTRLIPPPLPLPGAFCGKPVRNSGKVGRAAGERCARVPTTADEMTKIGCDLDLGPGNWRGPARSRTTLPTPLLIIWGVSSEAGDIVICPNKFVRESPSKSMVRLPLE